jgi:SAM-dependent methyltransferase
VKGSVRATWDCLASVYDSKATADPVYLSCIRQAGRAVPKSTHLCLDAGCGTGLSTVIVGARCQRVVAADYSIESLRVLKKRALANVFLVQADLNALPFVDSAFDAVVCANTLQHLKPEGEQGRAIKELRRVVRKRGIVCVCVHHYSRSKRRAGWIKAGKPGQAGIDYIYRFSREELQALVPNATIRGVGFYGLLRIPYLGAQLQDLGAILCGWLAARLACGHMLLAVAKNGLRGRDLCLLAALSAIALVAQSAVT